MIEYVFIFVIKGASFVEQNEIKKKRLCLKRNINLKITVWHFELMLLKFDV